MILTVGVAAVVLSGGACRCSSAPAGTPAAVTATAPSATSTPVATPKPTATAAPTVTPAPTAMPIASPTPSLPAGARKVTLKDDEVTPLLPIKSAWAHFLPNNEVRVGYKGLGFRLKLGIVDGRLYADGVPPWLDLAVVDKNAPKYAKRDGGRVIITDFPAWFDLSRYDKELTAMPELVALETQEGEATVWYLPLP